MVAGHLREQNGIYQMILSYKGKDNKRKTKSISTHLPVKGNKKRAEAMLAKARKEFIPTLWDGDTLLQDFLADRLELSDLLPDKFAYYDYALKTHIKPYFDNLEISIANLTTKDLELFYQHLRQHEKGSLSDAAKETLEACHYVIKNGLAFAVSAKWIESNPADKIDPLSGEVEILFSDFILEWVEMMKNCVDITTYYGYSSAIKKKIAPYFAEKGYTLKDLENNPKYIQDYYQYELTENHLTTNTVIHRHANIRKCLQYAFQIGMIKSNPADRVERPQKNVFVPEYYNAQELEQLFRAIRNDPLEIPILLAAFYGMRRSEALGLKWNMVDFEQKTITVNHVVMDVNIDGHIVRVAKDKTKTKSSTRTLPLVAPFEAALLKLKKQQEEDRKQCGKAYCTDYLEYINRDKMGERMKPDYLSGHFKIIARKAGLKKIRFHDLRHSCASLLYANEVDLKAIQEWLGHSTITTTANTYTHFDFSKKVQSANAILNSLSGHASGDAQ